MGKGIGGHTRPHKGASDMWLTPPHVIAAFPPFDLDPCGHPQWPTANQIFASGGLDREWTGTVWLNPPYGPEAEKWLEKLAEHGDGIALTFARTDTNWWHRQVAERADSVLFLEGRLFFHRGDGIRAKHNSGGPSALIAYGENANGLLKACGLKGWLVKNKK